MSDAGWILSVGAILLILLRTPFAVALGLCTFAALWVSDIDTIVLAQKFISGTQTFSLLAIPFFVLAGDLMTAGGISRRLVGLADVLVRHRTGGLGMVTVLAAAFFAAISGSAPATTAAIGAIMIPEMEKRGYDRAFAAALAVAGGIIGPMIPPSIPFVVWGVIAEQSISRLFLAGVVPGLLLCAGLALLCWLHARRTGVPRAPKATRREILSALNQAKWALFGPVFVLGGIYAGIVTPTEAAVVAVVFALVVGGLAHHELSFRQIYTVSQTSLRTMTIVMFIIAAANGFGWIIAFQQIPRAFAEFLASVSGDPTVLVLVLNVGLLAIGCVMDNLAAMIVLSGFLISLGDQLGMDPIQFGTMITLNFTIGMATPPFGYAVFVGAAVSGLPISRLVRPLLPMLGVMVVVLLIVAFVPPVSLLLQKLLMG